MRPVCFVIHFIIESTNDEEIVIGEPNFFRLQSTEILAAESIQIGFLLRLRPDTVLRREFVVEKDVGVTRLSGIL